MNLIGLLSHVLNTPATPSSGDIITEAGDIITAVLSYLSQITTWILGDPLAVFFYGIMFFMLVVHALFSLINQVK